MKGGKSVVSSSSNAVGVAPRRGGGGGGTGGGFGSGAGSAGGGNGHAHAQPPRDLSSMAPAPPVVVAARASVITPFTLEITISIFVPNEHQSIIDLQRAARETRVIGTPLSIVCIVSITRIKTRDEGAKRARARSARRGSAKRRPTPSRTARAWPHVRAWPFYRNTLFCALWHFFAWPSRCAPQIDQLDLLAPEYTRISCST